MYVTRGAVPTVTDGKLGLTLAGGSEGRGRHPSTGARLGLHPTLTALRTSPVGARPLQAARGAGGYARVLGVFCRVLTLAL